MELNRVPINYNKEVQLFFDEILVREDNLVCFCNAPKFTPKLLVMYLTYG